MSSSQPSGTTLSSISDPTVISITDQLFPIRRRDLPLDQAPRTLSTFVTPEDEEEIYGLKDAVRTCHGYTEHPTFCHQRRDGDLAGNQKRLVLANKYGLWPQGLGIFADMRLHSFNVHWVYWTINWAGMRYIVQKQESPIDGPHWRRWMGVEVGLEEKILGFTWDPSDPRKPTNNPGHSLQAHLDEYPHEAPYYEDDPSSEDESEEESNTTPMAPDTTTPATRDTDAQVLDATAPAADNHVPNYADPEELFSMPVERVIPDSEEEVDEEPARQAKIGVKRPASAEPAISTSNVLSDGTEFPRLDRSKMRKRKPRRTTGDFEIFDENVFELAQEEVRRMDRDGAN
ncbi:MAG: hypothetical protein Q9209_006830 [Squamulea sp. 1 TL-2023]